jgi:hypothetical protein
VVFEVAINFVRAGTHLLDRAVGKAARRPEPSSSAIWSIVMADRTIFYAQQGRRAVKLIFESVLAGSFLVIAVLLAGEPIAIAQQNPQGRSDSCAADNGSIALSPGFCATVFADNLGHARQMAFGPNGVLYINTWSGRYYQNDRPPAGGFLI